METVKQLSLRDITPDQPLKISFVCLGNICRSPTAEGVFRYLVNREGLSELIEIDSAGTGAYHVGEPANSKSRKIAEQYGISLDSRARQFQYSDFEDFDLIIAMDKQNKQDLQMLDRNKKFHDNIHLLRDFDPDPDDRQVPDPYYGGINGFEHVFDIVLRSCEQLLEAIRPAIKKS